MGRITAFVCLGAIACATGGLDSKSLGNKGLSYDTVASVAGQLKDSDGSVADASVAMGAQRATSRSDGGFELRGLPAGKQTLSVEKSGYARLEIEVDVTLGMTDVGTLELVRTPVQTCQRGYSECGGACVDETSDDAHCGGCDTACASNEICEDSQCVALPFDCTKTPCPLKSYCDTQTNKCVAGCKQQSHCPADKVCDGGACVCGANTHVCFGQCASNTSPQTCGNDCTPCIAPANGTSTCDGTKCGYECTAPYIRCTTGCCEAFQNVASVSSTGWHMSCAKTQQNDAWCWGNNDHGAIGDGTSINIRNVPTKVDALAGQIVDVSAGYMFSCAIVTGGGVKCWGRGQYGQLGNGFDKSSLDVVSVSGLQSGVTQLSAGGLHSCAVVTGGQVRCWGGNNDGELGNGADGTYSVVPQTVCTNPTTCNALTGIAQVSAGTSVTCAVSTNNVLYCWGSNLYGRLGYGMAHADMNYAGTVASGYKKVTVGDSHVCGITTSDGLKCWGFNGHGELGDGTKTTRYVPTDVSGLQSGVLDVTIGDSHTCAFLTGGVIKCWGYNNKGQLGDGTIDEHTTPMPVLGLAGTPIAVSAGEEHTCALLSDHRLQCWGNNEYGELGDSTNSNVRATPGFVLADP